MKLMKKIAGFFAVINIAAVLLLAVDAPKAPKLTDDHQTELLSQYRKILIAQMAYNNMVNAYNQKAIELLKKDGFPEGSQIQVDNDRDLVTVLPPPKPVESSKPEVTPAKPELGRGATPEPKHN